MLAPDAFAPITDLGEDDALEEWRFLTGGDARVRLLTAMGDVFFLKPHGVLRRQHVFVLDTFTGQVAHLVSNWQAFKRRMANPDQEVASWLKYDILLALHAAGSSLAPGECYSPIFPAFLSGKYEAKNFSPTPWRHHLSTMAQMFIQVKDLPEGTRITGIKWERI